jgi:hypothetical protein
MGQIRRQGEQFETHVIADKYGDLLDYGPNSGVVDAFEMMAEEYGQAHCKDEGK